MNYAEKLCTIIEKWKLTKYDVKASTVKVPFLVKVSVKDLNIRSGSGTGHGRIQCIQPGVYTIVEVKSGTGSTAGWRRLKSNLGWIALDYCQRL